MAARPWRVYVASPYGHAATVRAVHEEFSQRGWRPTSRWALTAFGPETLACRDRALLRAAGAQNDADILSSNALLVLIPRKGRPKETYCEARFAQIHAIPVVWVGPACLTTFRPGVRLCASLSAAMDHLEEIRVGPKSHRRLTATPSRHHEARS